MSFVSPCMYVKQTGSARAEPSIVDLQIWGLNEFVHLITKASVRGAIDDLPKYNWQ